MEHMDLSFNAFEALAHPNLGELFCTACCVLPMHM